MKHIYIILCAAALMLAGCAKTDPIHEIADIVFERAKSQYILMDAALEKDKFPRSTDAEGGLITSDMGWWCSGFFPGSLWYIYEYSGDEGFRDLAWKHTRVLEGLIERKTDHDIGFQINCSYGNALRLTGDSTAVVPTYLAAAEKLAARLNPATGVIRSWDWLRDDWQYPVIIDNMMNLELLTAASRISGQGEFAETAVKHASTTLKNHFRPDWSSWHLVDYDPVTGDVRSKETVQGYSDDSAWARGQAWALYGYTMMFRETGRTEYLTAAEGIADMIIGRLPEDGIPYWDFNAPADGGPVLRDASAGAIMASAFIELSGLTMKPSSSAKYIATARKQLTTLASDEYLARPGTNGFFLLRHGVGNIPGGTEIDVPLSYADYYFLEALVRYCHTSS